MLTLDIDIDWATELAARHTLAVQGLTLEEAVAILINRVIFDGKLHIYPSKNTTEANA